MPTRRPVTSMAKMAANPTPTSQQGAAEIATILRVVGGIDSSYEIRTDSGSYGYYCKSTVDLPLAEGDRVYVMVTGTQSAVIVGVE